MPNDLVAVVLAGGSGTRLWPLSRTLQPKQFLPLLGSRSMFAETLQRLEPMVDKSNMWVVTGQDLATGAGYQDLQGLNCLIEPAARNTAPAIGVMAAYLADFSADPILLVLPADHVIADVPAFHAAIETAVAAAREGKLVTFGITPTRPETGYGYILATGDGPTLPITRFVEKPDAATAAAYVAEGTYYWNSGMFVARASTLLAEMALHAPELFAGIEDMRRAWRDGADWKAVVAESFAALPSISLDYAVMEKSRNAAVVPCAIGWSDVGSWDAVYEALPKDAQGNVLTESTVVVDAANNLVMSQGSRVIATVGVENLCIVDTPDALLVAHRDHCQKVKQAVDVVQKRGGEEHIIHRTAQRPWGSYTVLDGATPGYKVKRIEVLPGGRLSLQSHRHRSEHWVVVQGTATVTNGDNVMQLTPGQNTYIPLGAKHRLENQGDVPVQLIEVQVGDYLGEDDIQRFDDVYGRAP